MGSENSDKMDDIDVMFSHLLEEMDDLTQSLVQSADTAADAQTNSSGASDLNEPLNNLDKSESDHLLAQPEETLPVDNQTAPSDPPLPSASSVTLASPTTLAMLKLEPMEVQNESPAPKLTMPQTANNEKPPQTIIKVWMSDGSTKTLMVEGTQTVRDVLDKLFEKTYCDCATEWSLCEINQELHVERILEDHECFVESLSMWSSVTDNKLYFLKRPQKYVIFTQPQFFYMWKRSSLKAISEQEQQLLLKENFGGLTAVVPDLEGWLYLKDDGRKVWKPRYFVLRASGLYYVPKGKTKSSSDLACFVRFEQVNVYSADGHRIRYRAPTDYCFVLKHPCIQKESQYVKFLCCENEDTVLLWVNSIRIAKYGTVLYENYKTALKRAQHPPDRCSTSSDNLNSQIGQSAPTPDECIEQDEPPPDFIPPPPPGYMAIL
ncbi:amyloid beta A4 precursor protein-binding family B member 1-interacting protein-like isoform X2 [Boleophthalmus pectinirostris]|uniref:amyloid beta A4 precursor protein-binding family B member 1-interacting protein-like isoform X2 n=1 Tax=Boleophthalmus pectinirostris TaxID=150288 RepID=UPI00242C93B1|nr:amyloid beta A4 precursor protein-binding family B member 1-interacting protein-like isoform X2 [Boleophthalmus pectinirostris]